MAELILEPYAVVQHWHLPDAGGHWEAILAAYLQTLAQRCAASGQVIVGHIKALALFSDQSYLRVSVVAPNLPASITGNVPAGCTDLDLTLNILVYGLERTRAAQITSTTAHETASHWKGDVSHLPPNLSRHAVPPSIPQEPKEQNDE